MQQQSYKNNKRKIPRFIGILFSVLFLLIIVFTSAIGDDEQELAKYNVSMHIYFESNWFFNKYNLNLKVDGSAQETLNHGQGGDFNFQLPRGTHEFVFEKEYNSLVNGSIVLDVKGEINISLHITCHDEHVGVETIYIEDMGAVGEGETMVTTKASSYKKMEQTEVVAALEGFGFTNITAEPVYDVSSESSDINLVTEVSIDGNTNFNRGSIFSYDAPVIVSYHEDRTKDPEAIAATATAVALESTFPKEMAKRAIIVAMTNCQATDVFYSDGNTFDQTKFHSYSDIDNFFMSVEKNGTWSVFGEDTWHIKNMILSIYGYDTYLKVSGNIKQKGENYIFFNVDQVIASEAYINSTDSSKVNYNHLEPSDNAPFLTVPISLISQDRDTKAAQNKMMEREKHKQWIESQFNWWDGRHETLSDLIKRHLNDSDSFKHVDARYIDVYDEEKLTIVNDMLEQYGYSERADIGDLLVMETFTAKNKFNATIKSVGYGLVRSSGTVILLGID